MFTRIEGIFLILFIFLPLGCSHVSDITDETGWHESQELKSEYNESMQRVMHALWLTHTLAINAPKYDLESTEGLRIPHDPSIYEDLQTSNEFGLLAYFSYALMEINPASMEYTDFCWGVHMDCIRELSKRFDENAGRCLSYLRWTVDNDGMLSLEVDEAIKLRDRALQEQKNKHP